MLHDAVGVLGQGVDIECERTSMAVTAVEITVEGVLPGVDMRCFLMAGGAGILWIPIVEPDHAA